MNPYLAYQQQRSNLGWTRIDMLLALYDKAITRLEEAIAVVEEDGPGAARPLLLKYKLILGGLVAGVNPDGGEIATNFLRLLGFVAHCVDEASPEKLRGALRVLLTLREGLLGIHEEAVQLERDGVIPPVDSVPLVHHVG
jgi:flagellin-specific chaperone FliS